MSKQHLLLICATLFILTHWHFTAYTIAGLVTGIVLGCGCCWIKKHKQGS